MRWLLFFLVGHNSGSQKGPSSVEYSESSLRDDIKSSGKFAIRSPLKIGWRKGGGSSGGNCLRYCKSTKFGVLFNLADLAETEIKQAYIRKHLYYHSKFGISTKFYSGQIQLIYSSRNMPKQFSQTLLVSTGLGVCPCLPSILTEYPVYLGVGKPPTLSDNIHRKSYMHYVNPSYIVSCHLPRAPSYGGVRTWVEGSQIRGDRALARASNLQYKQQSNHQQH